MTGWLVPLRAAKTLPRAMLGEKAWQLLGFSRLPGVRVPDSWVLPADGLYRFAHAALTQEEWGAAEEAGTQGGIPRWLFARLMMAPLPAPLRRALASLRSATGLVILRSSGIAEDGARTSLAGHYDSRLSPAQVDDLGVALKQCWLLGLNVYFQYGVGPPGKGAWRSALHSLAVLIQGVVPAERSGVLFTRSPVDGRSALAVANWGSCHSVVDGRLVSDTYQWPRRAHRTPRFAVQVSRKMEMSVPAAVQEFAPGQPFESPVGPSVYHLPYGPWLATARVPWSLRDTPVLDQRDLTLLAGTGRRLEAWLGRPADIEWSFDGQGLKILQVRPITTPAARARPPDETAFAIASPGVATGRVRIVTSPSDARGVKKGDIAAVRSTDPDYMPLFYRAGAVLSEEGSLLSHAAIVARELGLPCLVGVAGATSGLFSDGEIVTVDANAGQVLRGRLRRQPAVRTRGTTDATRYDVRHLAALRGGDGAIAASAVLADLLSRQPFAELWPQRVQQHVQRLRQEHGLRTLRVRWDLLDDELLATEQAFDATAVRAALEGA